MQVLLCFFSLQIFLYLLPSQISQIKWISLQISICQVSGIPYDIKVQAFSASTFERVQVFKLMGISLVLASFSVCLQGFDFLFIPGSFELGGGWYRQGYEPWSSYVGGSH